MKKIIIALLALVAIIGGIFGVTKVREIHNEQSDVYDSQNEIVCLYGCPSVKRRKFIKIK